MDALIWLAVISCGLSLVLTPVIRNIFRSWGMVDHPDDFRKTHLLPVPRVGGIAIAISYAASFFIVQSRTGIVIAHLALVMRILPAACVILAVGIIDDLWGLRAWQKLAGQVIAGGVACWNGLLVVNVLGMHSHDWWTVPITILWLLICCNGFNLVDGIDGLAAGAGLFATLTIFAAALMARNVTLAMATLPLAGCLLGFLRYNFNPASIFLGDSGSLLIGFLLGSYAIVWNEKSTTLLGMAAPLMALSLPLFDVGLAIIRRMMRRQPIFSADRDHIHHRLLALGMSPRKVALLLYGICGVGATLSLIQNSVRDRAVSGVIVLLFCGIAWVGIGRLDYREFSLTRDMIFGGGLQRNLKAETDLATLRASIAKAMTALEAVQLVERAAVQFGFAVIRMRVADEDFDVAPFPDDSLWEARVAIADGNWIDLARVRETAFTGLFMDTVASSMSARIPALTPAMPRVGAGLIRRMSASA